MKIILVSIVWFVSQTVCQENSTNLDNELDLIMKQYESDPIFQKVKAEFHKKYGNRDLNVLERMLLLKDNLKKFYELTNRQNIPDDLKSVFRITMKSLKPDFTRVDHTNEVLTTTFNLTETEAAGYRKMYSEVESMFADLEDRFQIEGDC